MYHPPVLQFSYSYLQSENNNFIYSIKNFSGSCPDLQTLARTAGEGLPGEGSHEQREKPQAVPAHRHSQMERRWSTGSDPALLSFPATTTAAFTIPAPWTDG